MLVSIAVPAQHVQVLNSVLHALYAFECCTRMINAFSCDQASTRVLLPSQVARNLDVELCPVHACNGTTSKGVQADWMAT